MTLIDKKYKFADTLRGLKADADKKEKDVDLVKARKDALLEQVVDNRRIRVMDSLGNTYSTGMAGGMKPTAVMWNKYFRIADQLIRNSTDTDQLIMYKGKWQPVDANSVPTSSAADKVTGNYWLVDLSSWNVDAPTSATYEASDATKDADGHYVVSYQNVDDVWMTPTTTGEVVPEVLIGTPKVTAKTDIPGTKCSVSLDGTSTWYHGDIVYVDAVKATNGQIVYQFKRFANLASGTEVTLATE